MKNSIKYGTGIRILNQDLWETIISFIISANNNIPRIKGIIERLAKNYGKEIEWQGKKYYTFPTAENLKEVTVEEYRSLGLGFRDIRLYETTKMILNNEVNLEELEKRLRGRATESEENIQKRLKVAKIEMENQDIYPHVIINEEGLVTKAALEVYKIIKNS